MRRTPLFLAFLAPLLAPTAGWAQSPTPEPKAAPEAVCEPPSTCVPEEDMRTFVSLLREKKCQLDTPPTFVLDPITIVVDKEGRIFYSGAEPHPYTVKMNWCGYEVEAQGKVDVVAAQAVEDSWGWEFRLKAAPGYLPVTAFLEKDALKGFDFGLLAEPFHLWWANINAYVGFRSFGGGLGFDLTPTVGLYAGYALTWGTWTHNPHAALFFDLW